MVEEFNDYEIQNQDFMRARETKNAMVSSLQTNSIGLGQLLEDDKL